MTNISENSEKLPLENQKEIKEIGSSGDMKVWSLASGSKANCTLICSGDTKIFVDFGVSCRYAKTSLAKLGMDISEINSIFITHEHYDHIGGLETLFKSFENIPVHMTEPSYLSYIRGKGYYNRKRVTSHEDMKYSEKVGSLTVSAMPVMHDSAACVAYKIKSNSGCSLGICTDAGSPTDALFEFFSDCQNVITECNHDVVMLKCGSYPAEVKRRILSNSGHTSNADCAEFAVRLANAGVKGILLSHMSPENNTRDLALYTVNEALKRSGVKLDYLEVAPRYELFAAF